jgi:hypothetical protein
MGLAFLNVMKVYGWRRVTLLSVTSATPCYYGALTIYSYLTAANISVYFVHMPDTPKDSDLNDYMLSIQTRARGMLLFLKMSTCLLLRRILPLQVAYKLQLAYSWFDF